MNLITGYLPVWLTSAQHDEYIGLLSKHYNVEYFNFEELAFIEPVVPNYLHITANKSGRRVCTYYRIIAHSWEWYTKQDDYHYSLSLMKIE